MIKIQVLSDMHFEGFHDNLDQHDDNNYNTDCDVVIVPGDISRGHRSLAHLHAMFPDKIVIFTPGNHEYYEQGKPITQTNHEILEYAKTLGHIYVLMDDVLDITIKGQSCRFVGGTLWSDFKDYDKNTMDVAQLYMNDYKTITGPSGNLLLPSDTKTMNRFTKSFFQKTLTETRFNGPVIVLSHHMPSNRCVHPRFQNHPLTDCFVSQCDPLFPYVTAWCFGHTHDTHIHQLDGCLLVCNPKGNDYDGHHENEDFNPRFMISLHQHKNGVWKAETCLHRDNPEF